MVTGSSHLGAPCPIPSQPWYLQQGQAWEAAKGAYVSSLGSSLLPHPCLELLSPLDFGTSQSGMSSTQSGGWEGQGPGPGPAAGSQAAACGPEQASQT